MSFGTGYFRELRKDSLPTMLQQSRSLRDKPRSLGVEFIALGNNTRTREPHYRNGMQNTINKPIFVVGSPRSGTSILTWCLGQHPNIFPVDESTGIGELAVALAVCYQTKMGLGPDSLWSFLSVQKEEFFAAFGQTISELIQRHKVDLERKWWEQTLAPNVPPHDFPAAEATSAAKTRWVDGTPVYSFHICGLRKLFPNALFIHIIRDVASVVRSMLNFHRLAGMSLVANEQEAYDYWFRAVTSCLLAEQAYGPGVIFRLRYADLVDHPEASLRALFSFLAEPFAAACLAPLRERINSSSVPADFELGSPDTDPSVVERATQLCAEIEAAPQPPQASTAAVDKIEAAFNERVQYVATLDSEYVKAQQVVTALQTEREQMRDRYKAEKHRLRTEIARNVGRAERLANEIKRKRATICRLRARGWRHKLRRLIFGQDAAS
jgi:hypothetical protein